MLFDLQYSSATVDWGLSSVKAETVGDMDGLDDLVYVFVV